jgi:tetratricopeptide (TPR) repeat protein/DNA-binding LytR/AlgR family response regulator
MYLILRLLYLYRKGLQPLLLLYLISLCLPLKAQNNELLLLEQKIILAKEDSLRAQLLNDAAFLLRVNNPKKALAYSNMGMELSLKSKYKIGLMNSYIVKGLIYKHLGDFEKAIINYVNALKIAELSDDKHRMSSCYNNIGSVYQDQKNYTTAIQYFNRSLEIEKKIGSKSQISIRLYNLGASYESLNKLDTATEYYKKSLLLEESLNNIEGITYALYGLGGVYTKKGYFSEAELCLKKAFDLAQKNGDISNMSYCSSELGNLYRKRKNPEIAANYYKQSINYADSLNEISVIMETYHNLALTYADLSDYKNAFEYFLKFNKVNDKLNNSEINRKIAEVNTIYEVDKMNREMEMLKKESIIQDLELQQQRNLKNYLIFTSILIIFVLVIIYQRRKSSNKSVENPKRKTLLDLLSFLESLFISRVVWTILLSVFFIIYFAIIQPFNTNYLNWTEKAVLFAVYGSISLAISNLSFLIISPWNAFFRKRSIMTKYFLLALLNIGLLTVIIWLFNYIQGIDLLNFKSFRDVLLHIIIFAILPVLLIIFSAERIYYAQYIENIPAEPAAKNEILPLEEKLITINTDSSSEVIRFLHNDLICFEANDNYTAIYLLKDGKLKKDLYRITLKKIESQIFGYENIIRCHKSYIININYLDKITGNAKGFKMHLRNLDFEIPVSVSFPRQVIDALKINLINIK